MITRLRAAGPVLVFGLALAFCAMGAAAPARAACSGYAQNTSGTTADGVLSALVDICGHVAGPQSSSSLVTSPTTSLGTSATTVDAAQTRRSYILLHNPAALGGATISCAWGTAAVLNAGGTVTIYPGQYLTYEGSAAPNGALSCIASAASSPFTAQLLDQ